MLRIEQLAGKLADLRGVARSLQEFLQTRKYDAADSDRAATRDLLAQIDTLTVSFSTIITPLIADQLTSHVDKSEKFNSLLCEYNIPNKIDDMIRIAINIVMKQDCIVVVTAKDVRRGSSKKIVNVGDAQLDKIYRRLTTLRDAKIVVQHEMESPDRCDCGDQMEINPEDSQYICPSCGITKQVDGVIFRDDQSYAQNGTKTRANDYSAMRHLNDWMPKIFGEERPDVPQSVLDKVRGVMIRDELTLDGISNVCKMREILRDPDVAETKYNDHTTQIIKRIGGKHPSSPTDTERGLITAKYKVIISHYSSIAGEDSNVKYCPYFVFKIIEIFFSDNRRMTDVLNYIHLQSMKTVAKNDEIFEKIVAKTDPQDGFRIIPTDREKYRT